MFIRNAGKLTKLLIILLIGTLLLSACGNNEADISETDDTDKLAIVTSFYPVYIAAINVTRDIENVTVKNMTAPQTGCLHDYSLKPQDLKTLEKADVFVINGAGMESFIDKVVKQRDDLEIVDASENIELLKDENGEENPHVWVSVSNAIKYVNNIADKLSAIDPGNSQKYKTNAENYTAKLEALRKEMHDAIDPLKNRDIITFHEAFPYFAQEFDLNIAAVVEREPDTEPTAKELEEVIDLVNNTGVKALFAEPQYSPKIAETIARETGAKVYTLDPVVTGKADEDAYNDYIERMRENMNALVEALR